jgi:hypothetical protein
MFLTNFSEFPPDYMALHHYIHSHHRENLKPTLFLKTALPELGYYTVFIVQTYQTSQYVVLRGGIFLGKWRSSFAGSSDGKMNVQSACTLNT